MNLTRATLIQSKATLTAALLAMSALITTVQPADPPDTTENRRESLLQLLRERNIFNPNRRGPVREEREPNREPEPQRESFQLIGALTTPEQQLAFFDGSNPDFRRVINVGDLIAGFKVTAITTTSVQLEQDTNQIEIAVGTGMERVGDTPWETSSTPFRSTSPTTTETIATNNSPGNNPETTSPAGGEENDILKRMLERRRQEESQ
ncbi:MAG: hypothetical protein RI897_1962 [Verrucomicrobiota bacterium]|jgi:hypothetical protein